MGSKWQLGCCRSQWDPNGLQGHERKRRNSILLSQSDNVTIEYLFMLYLIVSTMQRILLVQIISCLIILLTTWFQILYCRLAVEGAIICRLLVITVDRFSYLFEATRQL